MVAFRSNSIFRITLAILGLSLLACNALCHMREGALSGLTGSNEINEMNGSNGVTNTAAADQESAMNKLLNGFTASFSLILATEVGDKTFFIAVVLAMRHRRRFVLAGALGALYLMTGVSALVGQVLTLLPVVYTHMGVIALLLYFGISLLREGMQPDDGESEFDKLQDEVEHDLDTLDQKKHDVELAARIAANRSVMIQAFTLTFFAEWGDRSQIATIALAAAYPVSSVIVGGCLGHSICTAAAVMSGRLLKAYISEKTVAILGGSTFLIFALVTYIQGP
eukprot:TRINITY_DN325_c0_g1_i1.p1 TRINITY_DN325_c0_g1~~TRINITY_DN325_c0_g1_i1.p1  ORF type:complete len:281 (-),score=67.79 TRINITY_DN325_c0_g1_i1:653-1495(-)